MSENGFNELIVNTAKLENKYRTYTAKKLIITELEWLNKYPYKTTPLEGLVPPITLGITDRYFGGRAQKAGKVKGKPYFILADKIGNTVGLLIRDEDLEEVPYQDLRKLAAKYKIPQGSAKEIIEKLLTI